MADEKFALMQGWIGITLTAIGMAATALFITVKSLLRLQSRLQDLESRVIIIERFTRRRAQAEAIQLGLATEAE